MSDKTLELVIETTRQFVQQYYPEASLVLLCGSWARHTAHSDSDVDLFILDPSMNDLHFEGRVFDSWLIEACVLSPQRVQELFSSSARSRTAPVPHQVVDGMLVLGSPRDAEQIKEMAQKTLLDGPQELDETEKSDAQWYLTVLLDDLAHVPEDEVPALAAQCYIQIAKDAIDAVRSWRGDRKRLRRTLQDAVPELAKPLDNALIEAINGNREPLVNIGYTVLEMLGGRKRTYVENY